MILDIVLFFIGVALILIGANYLTEGAASISYKLGLTPLAVGLTVVAFGTSMPEFVVSMTSALRGNADIAVGNVVGSNIFNVLAILGITALIKPLSVSRTTLRNEIPLMVLVSFLLVVMALDSVFDRELGVINVISRSEGIVLLGIFTIFLSYILTIAKKHGGNAEAEEALQKTYKLWLSIVFILGGLAGLIFGGDIFVKSASNIARSLGVGEAFIGLTLVACGTSLPELATSIVAARKGHVDMAIGNVVGSNIFNILWILGAAGTITPIRANGITIIDLGVMTLSGIILYLFTAFWGKRTITRVEGGILLAVFLSYMTYLGVNL